MSKSPEKFLFVNHISSRGNKRLVTVVGGYPFYQSTGKNSSEENTFFPFGGISLYNFSSGWFLKPTCSISQPYFPQKLAKFITDNFPGKGEFFVRFGNLETILLSMLMGGGYWDGIEGTKLKIYLLGEFAAEIHSLQQQNRSFFDYYQKLDTQTVPELNNNEQINELLARHSFRLKLEAMNKNFKVPAEIDYAKHQFVATQSADNDQNRRKYVVAAIALCDEYLKHLRSRYDHQTHTIDKINAVQAMRAALSNSNVKSDLERLKQAYKIHNEHQELWKKHRDPLGLLIIKFIGHILTLGIVSKINKGTFSFWKPHSQVLSENLKSIFNQSESLQEYQNSPQQASSIALQSG